MVNCKLTSNRPKIEPLLQKSITRNLKDGFQFPMVCMVRAVENKTKVKKKKSDALENLHKKELLLEHVSPHFKVEFTHRTSEIELFPMNKVEFNSNSGESFYVQFMLFSIHAE